MFFFMIRHAGWDLKKTIVYVLTELIEANVWLKMEEGLF
jgi:hypothetical protein